MISIASFLSFVESREKKVKHGNERGIMGESKRGQEVGRRDKEWQ